MKIFIVEDDSFKLSKIETVISSVLPNASICALDNVHDAIVKINIEAPDVIVLDMSLPSHSAKIGEGSPLSMPSGGIEIILEMRQLKYTNIPTLILTQYPEIEIENEYYSIDESSEIISDLYGISNLVVIYYENDSHEWTEKVIKYLVEL